MNLPDREAGICSCTNVSHKTTFVVPITLVVAIKIAVFINAYNDV